VTGRDAAECISKIDEIDKLGLKEVALFLEWLLPEDRKMVYNRLKTSKIKKIPLVHLRHDMVREELKNLFSEYDVKYFTIHEDHFLVIKNWHGFYKKLYLEMSTDNLVAPYVKVEKIGGFCVDLAHYIKQLILNNNDYRYIFNHRRRKSIFVCNHLSGYDPQMNQDLHQLSRVNNFSYITNLPDFIFGTLIAIEIENPIYKQMEYIEYIKELLEPRFKTE